MTKKDLAKKMGPAFEKKYDIYWEQDTAYLTMV